MSELHSVASRFVRPIAQYDPLLEKLRVFFSEPYVIYEIDGQSFAEWLERGDYLGYVIDYNDAETGEHRQTRAKLSPDEFYEFNTATELATVAEVYIKEHKLKPVVHPFNY